MSTLSAHQNRLVHRSNAVQSFLQENEDVYASLTPFVKQATLLGENNKAIAALVPDKQLNGKGATDEKNKLKATIATGAGFVCALASTYALNTNNSILYNSINYTPSSILHLRDAEILGFVNTVVGIVTPLLSNPDFADYPVTADDLDALSENASIFNSNLGKAARMDSTSSIASGDINTILKSIQGNINQMNRLVGYFKDNNPTFVKAYRDATAVNHSGIRHSGIMGTIINETTEQPIKGATITLIGKMKTKTTATAADGTYEIEKFAPGKCSLTITAAGYETKTIEVTIHRGKTTELNMGLSSQVIEFKTA